MCIRAVNYSRGEWETLAKMGRPGQFTLFLNLIKIQIIKLNSTYCNKLDIYLYLLFCCHLLFEM